MSKVLVIPDIHLKPFIFDIAENIINNETIDYIVFVGDLLDEFYQSNNVNLYKETIDRAIKFKHDHPNTLFCWGNHDLAYFATDWTCSGNSIFHKFEIKHMLTLYEKEVEPKYVQYIDNYLFSHAGVSNNFIKMFNTDCSIDELTNQINKLNINTVSTHYSPIWMRPGRTHIIDYYDKYIQIVGHTPVKHLSVVENNVWIVDTFSLDPTIMKPYGDSTLLVIDTETNYAYIYKNSKLIDKVKKQNWYIYNF